MAPTTLIREREIFAPTMVGKVALWYDMALVWPEVCCNPGVLGKVQLATPSGMRRTLSHKTHSNDDDDDGDGGGGVAIENMNCGTCSL